MSPAAGRFEDSSRCARCHHRADYHAPLSGRCYHEDATCTSDCACAYFEPEPHMDGCRCPECDPDFNDPRNEGEDDYPLSRAD